MKKESFKSKILLYFILFATVPLMIGSFVILYQMYQTKKESIFHKHHQILKQVEWESDKIVLHIEEIGQYVKKQYLRKKHNLLTGLPVVQKNISTVLILDKNGLLKDYSTNTKNNLFKGYDLSNSKYFLAMKDGQKDYWSKVYLSQATSKPSISYTLRIDEFNIAVLVINLDALNNFAKKFISEDNSSMVRIIDKDGLFLAHPENPKYIHERKHILNSDIYKRFISKDYKYQPIIFGNLEEVSQIGVFGITKKLNWYVIVKERYDFIFQTFDNLMWFIILFIAILILSSIYFSIKLAKSILKPLEIVSLKMSEIAHGKYNKNIEKSRYLELNILISNFKLMQKRIFNRENKLKEFNENLELRVQNEVKKNKQQQLLMVQQSRLAQMGEMISMIAHQWRQPLNAISTTSISLNIKARLGKTNNDYILNQTDKICQYSNHLSTTIEDFRNFFKSNKKMEEVTFSQLITNVLNIVEVSITNKNIKIIQDLNCLEKFQTYPNELKQVILNLIKNSEDIVLEKNIQNPFIKIKSYKDENSHNLEISDNGGGVPYKIISKIFDPYFSTKKQKNGTGLGLYMSKTIIEEHCGGKLTVSNNKDGAVFKITL